MVSSDARSLTDIDALASRVKTEFDTFDLLFVNAGFSIRAPLESVTEAALRRDVQPGPFFAVQQVAWMSAQHPADHSDTGPDIASLIRADACQGAPGPGSPGRLATRRNAHLHQASASTRRASMDRSMQFGNAGLNELLSAPGNADDWIYGAIRGCLHDVRFRAGCVACELSGAVARYSAIGENTLDHVDRSY